MRALIVFVLWMPAFMVQADLYWQPVPGKGGAHGGAAKMFKLAEQTPDAKRTVALLHSDLQRNPLEVEKGIYRVKGSGKNNYHALVAREEGSDYRHLAVRYLYFNGKPVDGSPSDLLAESLGELEIVPDPLPREHWRYTSDKPYRFMVQFKGQPLPEQPVLVMTETGSTEILHSDSDGVLKLVIPDDFATVVPGARKNPPGELRIFSEVDREGINYQSSLSMSYYVNPTHWKSASLGAMAALGGLLFGLWLNRRLPIHSRRKKR
ncbi:hypothetical protein [Amphritea pacifica]|uniref:hypothetical protein n=1 Tax=Amphritea pacifica TaxID=2811233 RepID=UPI001964BB32|nr:hypothetical protein [Amphritea pacifica]MBN1007039.1 hypothetical protein [Amphritea pacifica]